jgi:uncharacterized protein YlxW (UPF0749 family)
LLQQEIDDLQAKQARLQARRRELDDYVPAVDPDAPDTDD